jgi:lipopolysaccharide heptosyltransferase II
VDVPDKEMHAVDRNYRFAELLGFADVPIALDLPVQPQARSAVERMLIDGGLKAGEPYALIAPGTRWETKRWPAERFAAVARMLRSEHGLAVVLAGAPDEVDVADRVRELAGGRVVNLAGRTSLLEMTALVAGAAIVVMNDTGPMHLAVALNRPLVAIYGPTNPSRTGPYGQENAVVRLDLACSPCYLKRLSQCPYGHRCMQQLTPQTVAERVAQVLAAGVH